MSQPTLVQAFNGGGAMMAHRIVLGGNIFVKSCLWKLGIIYSFIHSGYLYSAPSRNLLRGALSPATVKEKCLKKLAERRHVVLR